MPPPTPLAPVDGPSKPGFNPAEVECRRDRTEFLNSLTESGVRLLNGILGLKRGAGLNGGGSN